MSASVLGKATPAVRLRVLLVISLAALGFALAFVSSAMASFGIEAGSFESSFVNQDGSPVTQAGSHPYAWSLGLTFNHFESIEFKKKNGGSGELPEGSPKDLVVNLPAGMIVKSSDGGNAVHGVRTGE